MEGKCFRMHRERLVSVFKSHGINEGVIVYDAPDVEEERFTGSELPFIQDGMFYWLTGWEDPSAIILIDISTGKSTLLLKEYDEKYEIWTGPIPSNESVITATGVDEIKFHGDLNDIITSIKPSKIFSHTNFPFLPDEEIDEQTLLTAAAIARRTKFPHEIDALRRAAEATSEAIKDVWKDVQPGMMEYDVETSFLYHGAKLGGRIPSFLTIVAAGPRSVYLHYSQNKYQIEDGDLILLDCGLFIDHYAGDITRTFPANGKFSEDQKRVYDLLLAKQIELIEMVKPNITFTQLNNATYEKVFEVLKVLKIVPSDCPYDLNITRVFLPHGVSHHVGCNVHDHSMNISNESLIIETVDKARTIEANQIITIEPGIYFHAVRLQKLKDAPEYANIDFDLALHYAKTVGGIRIEDDVLVTETGFKVLSTCPKSSDDIEALMAIK